MAKLLSSGQVQFATKSVTFNATSSADTFADTFETDNFLVAHLDPHFSDGTLVGAADFTGSTFFIDNVFFAVGPELNVLK
jgi:hypothetical protein